MVRTPLFLTISLTFSLSLFSLALSLYSYLFLSFYPFSLSLCVFVCYVNVLYIPNAVFPSAPLSELIQTEFHHVRTLRIMEGVFRQGMLDEVLLEPGVAHAVFPCLEQLMALHTHFLSQLMTRRTHSLAPGSSTNFTINQLGDILTEQVGNTLGTHTQT